jgi:hypothetical protein
LHQNSKLLSILASEYSIVILIGPSTAHVL